MHIRSLGHSLMASIAQPHMLSSEIQLDAKWKTTEDRKLAQ
jgi:hypothetical protein